ncbi:MAG: ABC transporter substrate-binding protein [Chloroflexota bacterium]|nr:ABC transporter substrate-binding protein [Chloroflexota bacterium]
MQSITRRGFLWRTALLSGGAVVGSSLLAACGTTAAPPTTSGGAPAATTAPATTSGGAATSASPAAKPAGAAAQNATLNVGLGRVLQDLNGFDLDIASYTSQIQIYDTLLTYDSEGKAVPRLAESWTIAPDGSNATIKLRQGATFQNGTPVNADAILANYQKAQDSKFSFQIFSIIPRIKDLTKTDDLTLQMTMQGATPERVVTDILDSINIMEPSTLDTDYLKTKAIGAGPFAVDAYNPNNQLTLRRYDGFWKKPAPTLQQIVYHLSNDIDAQVASLQAGANDMVSFLPPNYTARLKDQYDIFQGPAGTEVYPFRLNPSLAPFDNKMVRQGMQYAINRQGIVDKVFYGYARPQALPFGETGPAYETEIVKNYPYDLQKAKQMFEAAGQPAWTAVLFIVQGDTTGLSIAQIVQADLASIGVKLDVQQISGVESGQHAFAGDYQMSYGILGNCGKYPTWVTLNSLMRVQNNPVLKGSAAPILDRWQKAIDLANAATTPDLQKTAFQGLRDVILDESWLITICDDITLVAMNKKVKGISINRDDFVVLENTQLQT